MSDNIQTARRRLEEAALKYARVRSFGADVERKQLNSGEWTEHWVRYDVSDAKVLEASLLGSLGVAAYELLREVSLTPLPPKEGGAP